MAVKKRQSGRRRRKKAQTLIDFRRELNVEGIQYQKCGGGWRVIRRAAPYDGAVK